MRTPPSEINRHTARSEFYIYKGEKLNASENEKQMSLKILTTHESPKQDGKTRKTSGADGR